MIKLEIMLFYKLKKAILKLEKNGIRLQDFDWFILAKSLLIAWNCIKNLFSKS